MQPALVRESEELFQKFPQELAVPVYLKPNSNNYESNKGLYIAKHRSCQNHSHLAVYDYKRRKLLYVHKLGGITNSIKFSPEDRYLAYLKNISATDIEIVDTATGRSLYSFATCALLTWDDFAFCIKERYFRYLGTVKKSDQLRGGMQIFDLALQKNLGCLIRPPYLGKITEFTATTEKMRIITKRPDGSTQYTDYPYDL